MDSLIDRGETVLVVDDLSTGKREHINGRAEHLEVDIRGPELVEAAKAFRPDVVTHLAARPYLAIGVEQRRDVALSPEQAVANESQVIVGIAGFSGKEE